MATRRGQWVGRVEWPTWGLIGVIYGGWGTLTRYCDQLPWPLVVVAGAWLVAWHLSLQHELIHGHPTRSKTVNAILGFAPLSLWLPYLRYRALHMAHHGAAMIADPAFDTESFYVGREQWTRMGPWRRSVIRVHNTLIGRLLLGPLIGVAHFCAGEARALARQPGTLLAVWAAHLAGVAAILWWLLAVCHIPVWAYLAMFVYPGCALATIRAFAEHRAAAQPAERTATVERAPILGFLFLFNNYHTVHHRWPALAWYRIPGRYKAHRHALVTGGEVYTGYFDMVRRYLLRQHHEPSFPSTIGP